MHLNSVSSVQSFTNRSQLMAFANASDEDLKTIAYAKASHDVNDKKHRRLSNALYYSIPVAAGIAEAVLPSKISRIGRLYKGLSGFAALALPFTVIDATFAAKNKIDKNCDKSAAFSGNHPILSGIATLGAGVAAFIAFKKGATKVAAKYAGQITEKVAPTVAKISEKLDASKVLNYASKQLAKMPSAFKELSKATLNWAPWMLIFASMGHTINHDMVKNSEYAKNYIGLKNLQNALNSEQV